MPIDQERVFAPFFPAIHGAGTCLLPAAEGTHDHRIDDGQVGVELARLPQQTQQVGVELVPAAHLLPEAKAAMGGHAGAAQLWRDVLPAAARGQDEPQDVQDDAMADAWPTAVATDVLLRRQVMSGEVEERIGHTGMSHDEDLLPRKAYPSADQTACRRFC
jgi:hypothetical protein